MRINLWLAEKAETEIGCVEKAFHASRQCNWCSTWDKNISSIPLGQQLLDMTRGTSGWRENAAREKYWLVNYWKVQRKPMGKVAKELKNNSGWGNRDMPENLVVELEASTMMESHRGLKELLTSEKSLNSAGSHEQQRQRRAHCQGRAKEGLGGVFQRSCDQAQLHHISKELGNLNLSSALFLVLRLAMKSTGCIHHAEKHRASTVWQDKSFKKWGGSKVKSE